LAGILVQLETSLPRTFRVIVLRMKTVNLKLMGGSGKRTLAAFLSALAARIAKGKI
jgi:hypothetical protein